MSIEAIFGFEDGKYILEYTGIPKLPDSKATYDNFLELVDDFAIYLLEGAGREHLDVSVKCSDDFPIEESMLVEKIAELYTMYRRVASHSDWDGYGSFDTFG